MDLGPEIDDEALEALDEAALRRMRAVAHLMDDAVRVPGTDYRFGLDPVLGVLPVAGDAASAAVSMYIVAEAANLGVSYETLLRMLANVGVDATVGSVPVLGTIVDTVLKANKRNVELVRKDLERQRSRRDVAADADSTAGGLATDDSEAVEIDVFDEADEE